MDQDQQNREKFHQVLVALLGSSHVYFQPPPTVNMTYPCIVYARDDTSESHADNILYRFKQRYQVTVIDRDPDSSIPGKIRRLPLSSFSRSYPADNLNHDVFNVFF
jgi:hypothetical protein